MVYSTIFLHLYQSPFFLIFTSHIHSRLSHGITAWGKASDSNLLHPNILHKMVSKFIPSAASGKIGNFSNTYITFPFWIFLSLPNLVNIPIFLKLFMIYYRSTIIIHGMPSEGTQTSDWPVSAIVFCSVWENSRRYVYLSIRREHVIPRFCAVLSYIKIVWENIKIYFCYFLLLLLCVSSLSFCKNLLIFLLRGYLWLHGDTERSSALIIHSPLWWLMDRWNRRRLDVDIFNQIG